MQLPSTNSSWWRRLEDVFRLCLQKMSWSRRIYSPYSYVFRRRLQDVFKKSWSRPTYSPWSYVFKTSSRRLRCLAKTSSKRLQDVFKTSWKNASMTSSRSFEDVFKTSSRRLTKMSSRPFRDVSSNESVLVNMFSRCLWGVFKTFLRCSPKILVGHTSEKFMVSV